MITKLYSEAVLTNRGTRKKRYAGLFKSVRQSYYWVDCGSERGFRWECGVESPLGIEGKLVSTAITKLLRTCGETDDIQLHYHPPEDIIILQ